jgi:hypothetical protein
MNAIYYGNCNQIMTSHLNFKVSDNLLHSNVNRCQSTFLLSVFCLNCLIYVFQAYIPIIGKFLKLEGSAGHDAESELILAHAWDSMLKINFLVHLHNLDDDKNDDGVASDQDNNKEFVNFIERLFVWGLEEVKILL